MLEMILLIVAAILIVLSLLQSGKSDGISGAFTGSGNLNLFANTKERGSEKIISNLTLGCGVVFFLLVILIRII
ncbi:MAG: preprotein translocase subunit SecG [Anaerorhabdus sp.]